MRHHHTIILTAFLLLAPLPVCHGEDLKVAVVDMQQLFKEYHQTNLAQKQINVERARIQKENNERLERIKKAEQELQSLKKDLENPAISDKKKAGIYKEFQQKTQDGVALDKERRDYLQRRNTSLNEKMVQRMRDILEEIRRLVEDRAKEKGYNLVLDKSGLSTSQVPVVLFSGLDDLTAECLASLNKDAPKADAN